MVNGSCTILVVQIIAQFKECKIRQRLIGRVGRQNKTGLSIAAFFDVKVAKIAFIGNFDLDELITSCCGLLCQAAKAIKGRHQMYEIEFKNIMVR